MLRERSRHSQFFQGDGKSKSSKGKATVSLSKDEETIKRLKARSLCDVSSLLNFVIQVFGSGVRYS